VPHLSPSVLAGKQRSLAKRFGAIACIVKLQQSDRQIFSHDGAVVLEFIPDASNGKRTVRSDTVHRVAILANLSPDSGIWRILEAFGYIYFGLAIWRIFESIWLQIFWFCEMYALYICTYLLTDSYASLLFLSLLMACKFVHQMKVW